MSPRTRSARYRSLALGLMGGFASLSVSTLADESSFQPASPVAQIARYSVIHPGPTLDQQDLLAMTAPLRVPDEIATVGGAVGWVLKPSGYRLVAPDRLSPEVKDLLNLPLPGAHRQFEALPLREVIALLVGPAFALVQDPVHRLITFQSCSVAASHSEVNTTANSPKPQRGGR